MGPTAIGKTDLAMQLSDKMPVKIISVDSVQIYKFLDIGSGKPNPDTLEAYPHDLVDILEPQENLAFLLSMKCGECGKKQQLLMADG